MVQEHAWTSSWQFYLRYLALANSATPFNTSILTTQKPNNCELSLEWDNQAIDTSFENDQDDTLSVTPGSPCMEDSVTHGLLETLPAALVTPSAPPVILKATPISKSSSSSSLDPTTGTPSKGWEELGQGLFFWPWPFEI